MTRPRPIILPATCPLCGLEDIVRLPADWQQLVEQGARVRIVGCGNQWHYADLDQPIPRPALAPGKPDASLT